MATQVQWRRGTTAQVNAFTGAIGEVVVDTQTHQLAIQDGVTVGGFRTGLAGSGTFNNATFTGTITFSSVTWSGTVTNTATITGGTYVNPAFTGVPTTPTQSLADSSTQVVNSAWVRSYVAQASPINLAIASAMPLIV